MVIRILIVEDEPPTARAVARLVGELRNYEVVGIEMNGGDALARLEQGGVDAVITDINMPEMDGLTLAAEIDRRYPGLHTIILSGYQKFEYARAAISYHVFDYLLKPLTREHVTAVLARLSAVISAERAETRQRLVRRAAEGGDVDDGVLVSCMALVVNVGIYLDFAPGLSPGQYFWDTVFPQSRAEAVLARFAETFELGSYYGGERGFVLLGAPAEIRAGAQALYGELTAATTLPVSLVLCAEPVGLAALAPAIRQLRERLRGAARLCASVFLQGNTEPAPARAAAQGQDIGAIVEDVCRGDRNAAIRQMELALDAARRDDLTQAAFLRMLESILHDSRLAGWMDSRRYGETRTELREALANSLATPLLAEDLVSVLMQITPGGAGDENRMSMADTIDQLERYLRDNYMHPISSEMLAGMFGYVQSYLSKMFRHYKRLSPSEYLQRIRVERARELLSGDPSLLVKDVAEAVGFKDQYYFSKIFKKETGEWPKDFQRRQARPETD